MKLDRQPWTAPGGRMVAALGWTLSLALLMLPLLTLPGTGAILIFLDFGGVIKGESKVKGHEEEIEILSFSNWSASNSGTTHLGGGGGAGKSSFSDISLVKWVDKSSPVLLFYCANGNQLKEATLKFVEVGLKGPRPVMDMEFKDVLISSYSMGGLGGEDRATDTVSLNFRSFSTDVYTYTEDSPSPDDTNYVTWDIAGNTGGSGSGPASSNTAPTISDVTAKTLDEDGSLVVNFTVGDAQSAAGALSVSRGSNNPLLLPPSSLVLGGSGTARTVTLNPVANQSGTATVTLTVSDGDLTTQDTFFVTVNPVNDPPGIAPVSDRVTPYETVHDFDVTLSDIDSGLDAVTLTGSADPAGLVASIQDLTGTGATRTVRIIPSAASAGTAVVTLTATDADNDSFERTFNFTINPEGITAIRVNGTGSATPIPFAENPLLDAEIGQLSVVDPVGASHAFTLVSGSPTFSIGGANGDRLLAADPAAFDFETNPTLDVTIRVTDLDNTARTRTEVFTVAVGNVNESPVITLPAGLPSTSSGTERPLPGITLGDPDAGSADVSFSVSTTEGALTLDDSGVLSGHVTGNGTGLVSVTASIPEINQVLQANGLRLAPGAAFTGTIDLVFTVDDLGQSGSGPALQYSLPGQVEVFENEFRNWENGQFTPAERAQPDKVGFDKDFDGDGIPNGVEYVLGSDPKNPREGGAAFETGMVEIGEKQYLILSFTRRIGDNNMVILLETATNLHNWESGPAYTTEIDIDPIDSEYEKVTVRAMTSLDDQPTQQFRLRIILNP